MTDRRLFLARFAVAQALPRAQAEAISLIGDLSAVLRTQVEMPMIGACARIDGHVFSREARSVMSEHIMAIRNLVLGVSEDAAGACEQPPIVEIMNRCNRRIMETAKDAASERHG